MRERIRLVDGEDGERRVAENFRGKSLSYSLADTGEYLQKCAEHSVVSAKVLIGLLAVQNMKDRRPIFIYGYFDRLDESVDIAPRLDALASLGCQVFIAVCSN